MATVSRHASDTVESTFSSSSSTVPLDSLQDMSDAALLDVRDQARFVDTLCVIAVACHSTISSNNALFHSKQIESMSKEIDMFEKFLKRLDPKDVQLKGE